MIIVKKINQMEIIVNCDQIEWIEFSPHAVMSLASGEKIVVDETPAQIIHKVIEYKRAIHSRHPGGLHAVPQTFSTL
jgi:flagellar protein FlbD